MSCELKSPVIEPQINLEDYLYMVEAISNNFNLENVSSIRDSEIFGYLSCELVSCLPRFDSRKASFEKYLSSHLFNKAIDFVRKAKRKKRAHNLEACTIEELCAIPDDRKENSFHTDMLPLLLAASPEDSEKDAQDRSILVEHYLGGKSVAELSEKYRTTRVTIYSRIKKVISKIRENHNLFE